MPRTTPPEPARRIVIAGQPVAYQLRHSQRHTIGLSIDHRGLRVGAPQRARLGDIENLIQQHGQWVLDKLAAWNEREPPQLALIEHGTVISVLGEALTVSISASHSKSHWQRSGALLALHVGPRQTASALLETALREEARQLFSARLALFAPCISRPTPPLALSSARTRWGSCSAAGNIRLNWRLILMPLAVVDYVVAHELAHLLEMNHSPRFWAVVESICPNWQALRKELRVLGKSLPNFM